MQPGPRKSLTLTNTKNDNNQTDNARYAGLHLTPCWARGGRRKHNKTMKLYKCNVSVTTVREGVLFMLSPDENHVKDPLWVEHADRVHGLHDSTLTMKKKYEIIDFSEVIGLSEVPEEWRKVLPWYHPQYRPSEDLEIREIIYDTVEDDGKWARENMEILEKAKASIEEKMDKLREFIPPNA